MLKEKPLAIDYLQEDANLQVFPNVPLLTSHKAGWDSINLAYYRQPPLELPESHSFQHIIAIPFGGEAVEVELFSDGCLQNKQYNSDDYAKGRIAIFPANRLYKLSWNKEVEFIHCYLEPEFITQLAHESINPDKIELLLELDKFDVLIHQICLALKADIEVDGIGSRFYADSMATALSAHLIRHYATQKHSFREYEGGLPKQKLKQAFEFINEHLNDEKLSLTAIAEELDISHYYFCRLFKQSTGITPHQYLIQQRVERAKQMLRQPNLKITFIAQECGFANHSHFAKYFRQHTGVTPKQFRVK
jgi:AraC family transcriptional regulator